MHKLNNFGPMKWAFCLYMKSKSIDQTAYTHARSLIRALAIHLLKNGWHMALLQKFTNLNIWMCRLIFTFNANAFFESRCSNVKILVIKKSIGYLILYSAGKLDI